MEENNKQSKNNAIKKKFHYFETFISKVLKQVSDNAGITSNAKQQLNSFLIVGNEDKESYLKFLSHFELLG